MNFFITIIEVIAVFYAAMLGLIYINFLNNKFKHIQAIDKLKQERYQIQNKKMQERSLKDLFVGPTLSSLKDKLDEDEEDDTDEEE